MSILPQVILNSIILGAAYALLAMGFNLIYGAVKFINAAHGATLLLGGYLVYWLAQVHGLNLLLSVLVAVLFGGFIGYALDKLIFKHLRKKNSKNLVMFIASLGAFTVIQAVLAIIFTSAFQNVSDILSAQRVYQIGPATITEIQLVRVILAIAVFLGLWLLLKKTLFGKAIQAISDDEQVAKIVGIDTDRIIARIFFIGSAISALAGAMIALDTGIEPTMGLYVLLSCITAAIMGGIGNIYGAILGGFALGFIENFAAFQFSGEWRYVISFSVLIVFLIWRPEGIIKS